MGYFRKDMKDESLTLHQGITRCPFLRNIIEPTNFSFSTSMPFPMPVREVGASGPIFEDGPNFDMAFRLFHGQNGVILLSGGSFIPNEKPRSETMKASFNPLAAKAATISLSGFGPGGPFGFDAFSDMFKNHKKKSESSKKSSKGGDPAHEALSNEWLQSGNCPIAKSYRAVSHVVPLVAKALQPPPGMKIRCNEWLQSGNCPIAKSYRAAPGMKIRCNEWLQSGNCPIAKSYRAVIHVVPLVAKALQPPPGMKIRCPIAFVAASSTLVEIAFAENLRPQPLPAKILVIGALAANVPVGVWREHTEKFSSSWFAAVYASVQFIAILRKSVLMPKAAMAFTIAASILGHVIGSRAERFRLKNVSASNINLVGTSVEGADRGAIVGVKANHCGGSEN